MKSMTRHRILGVASVWLMATAGGQFPVWSATWYAAADGNNTNGTAALPWGVQYAVTNTNPHLLSGDTVLFKGSRGARVERVLHGLRGEVRT